jgi:hypothetical protein
MIDNGAVPDFFDVQPFLIGFRLAHYVSLAINRMCYLKIAIMLAIRKIMKNMILFAWDRKEINPNEIIPHEPTYANFCTSVFDPKHGDRIFPAGDNRNLAHTDPYLCRK